MAQLAPAAPMEQAIEDLKRWERKVHEAQDWLASATRKLVWEGRGADAFDQAMVARKKQLDTAADALRAARCAMEDAHEDTVRRRRNVVEAEENYAHLVRLKALPAYLVGKTPPPHGDARWPDFLAGKAVAA